MRFVSTGAQVSELDRRTIELFGVPAVALMETAAHAVATAIRRDHHAEATRGVVVVCGAGNNGGDGFATARWLYQWGYPVAVVSVGEPRSDEAKLQKDAAFRVGVPFADKLGRPGLIVDAVFGVGLSREVTGRYAKALDAMRNCGAPSVAVDVPSGLHVDTGAALGPVPRAVRTVCFARLKPGLLCGDGPRLAGDLEVVDIGLPPGPELACAELPAAADLWWPRREADDHKGDSGRLVLVAGSERMAGAAILACRGALAAGAGLITLVAPRGAGVRFAALPPEVMWVASGEHVVDTIPEAVLDQADAVVVGPGLAGGQPLSTTLDTALRRLWHAHKGAVLFDADALPCAEGAGAGPRVITPHPGEAARLVGQRTEEVQSDRFGSAERLAVDGRIALLKGPYTLIAGGGRPLSVNPTNAATLASGGTGDVLSGVIGGLLARGVGAREAAILGAWVHGRAGERVAAKDRDGCASEVLAELTSAIAEIRR